MGDAETLLLAFVVVYLIECLAWVPRGGCVLSRGWSRYFTLKHAAQLPSNAQGAFHLALPLPPFGTTFYSHQTPCSLSSQALFAYSALCWEATDRQRHSAQLWSWNDIQTIAPKGRAVLLNGKPALKTVSPRQARFLARWLERIRSHQESDRPRLIRDWVRASLDREKVAARWEAYRKQVASIRLVTHVTFAFCFVLSPWWVWRFGLVQVILGLLAALFVQSLLLSLLYLRAHRALFPEDTEERFKDTLTIAMLPPAALRAAELLGRHLLDEFHFLAAAKVLMAPKTFQSLASQALRDLHFPLLPACPPHRPEGAPVEEGFRNLLGKEWNHFLRNSGLDPDLCLAQPKPAEPGNRSYCPRCATQYTVPEGTCHDCGGRPLLSLVVVESQPYVELKAGARKPQSGSGVSPLL